MEVPEELLGIPPPRLEDAGLEDCALPPESIHEAFLKAASAVRSRATSILSQSDDEDEATCVEDPWPNLGESSDKLVGILLETEPPGGCVVEKGTGVLEASGDKVSAGPAVDVAEGADKVVGIEAVPKEEESCVDELKGLKIGEKDKNLNNNSNGDDEKESDRPILTAGYV